MAQYCIDLVSSQDSKNKTMVAAEKEQILANTRNRE